MRDDRYRELAEVGDDLTASIMRMDSDNFGSQLDRAVQLCERV